MLTRLTEQQDKHRAKMLAEGTPIFDAKGKPITTKDGSRVVLCAGRVVVQNVGRLLVDANGRQLVSWNGNPVEANRGGTLEIHDGRLVLANAKEPLVDVDGDSVCLAGTKSLYPDAEAMGLPAEVASVAMMIDPSNRGSLGIDELAKDGAFGEDEELQKDGALTKQGALGEATLGKEGLLHKESVLGETSLGREGLLDEQGQLGVTKQEYLSILSEVGEEQGMYFPVLFLEACWSEIDEVALTRMQRSANVGLLYTSDRAGLKYTTVDYRDVSTQLGTAPTFADALHKALLKAYLEQKRRRSGGK